jgi:hypothetical protein
VSAERLNVAAQGREVLDFRSALRLVRRLQASCCVARRRGPRLA